MEKTFGSAGGWLAGIASTTAAVILAACGGGGGGGGVPDQGTLQLSMIDDVGCYEKVLVTVEKVRVQKSSTASETDAGWTDITPPNGPVKVDLMNLTNGTLVDLGAATVDAGTYSQLRLVLSDAANANQLVLNGGTTVALTTPSAQQSGLKIKTDFTVAANTTTPMLLDFDACKSIVKAGNSGQYILKPVVRLTPKFAGSIQGYVTTTMTLTATDVSAQQGGEIIRSTRPDSTGKFILPFLGTGTYTVVITSDNRVTGVVDSVPVGTSTTVLNGTTTAVVLPTSTMGTLTGTVTATSNNGSTTLVTDASVTAQQTVGSTLIEVESANVDFTTAVYTMSLPAAAPVSATFSGGLLSSFTTAGTAGAYSLRATSPTRGTSPLVPATVTGGTTTTVNISY